MTSKKGVPVSREQAQHFLAVVTPEWKSFWVHEGPVFSSLKDMAAALPKLTAQSFAHHVNEAKNDFADWVEFVVGDKELADAVRGTKTPKQIMVSLDRRLKELDRCLLKEGKRAAKRK
jgi:hypothetical protein